MNWLSNNWKLLFDGVGGTAAVAFIGYICKRWWESRQRPPTPVHATTTPQLELKPKHNIRFVEAKSIQAHSGIKDGKIHESPQGLGDFQVCVVCFRNEPSIGKRVQEPTLKSHIIYKDKNGEEITDVPRGVWLGELGETTVFESGKKKCLIIFLLSNQDTLKKLWNEEYHSETSWMADGPVFQIRDEGIRADVTSVEVRLLAHDICVLSADFEVGPRIGGGLPTLMLRNLSVA